MEEQNFRALYAQTLDKLSDLTDKQKAVLQAALKLFAAQGFEATSTAQIAAEAGVASGSVYKQFHSKEELLSAVLAPLFQGTFESAAQEFMSATFSRGFETLDDFVLSVVTDRLTFVHENFQEIKLMFGQLLTNPIFVTQIQDFFSKELTLFVLPAINQLKAEKKMMDLPNEMILQLAFGTVLGHFGKIIFDLNTLPLDEEIQLISRLLIKALRP
jgi:AcrR family transcriptional regulator